MRGLTATVGLIALLLIYVVPYTVLDGGWALYLFYVVVSLATLAAAFIETGVWGRGG